jgi:hypothetical protein
LARRHGALPIGQVEQHDTRLFSCPVEDDFATVGRYVEIADRKLASVHWNQAGNQIARAHHLSMSASNRLLAVLNIAMADTTFTTWTVTTPAPGAACTTRAPSKISGTSGEAIANYVNQNAMQRLRGGR